MAYAIIRTSKIGSAGGVSSMSDHNERERETLHADPAKKHLNIRLIGEGTAEECVNEYLAQTGVHVRPDSVRCIEIVITASPDFFKSNDPSDPTWQAFQKASLDFLKKEFGEKNVVYAVAHHDEKTPHLHAIVVPVIEKKVKVGRKVKRERLETRLSAKHFLGGTRQRLRDFQTDFHAAVAHLGLERGLKGSQATHQTVRQYYEGLAQLGLGADQVIKEAKNFVGNIQTELIKPVLVSAEGALAENQKLKVENEGLKRQLNEQAATINDLKQHLEIEQIRVVRASEGYGNEEHIAAIKARHQPAATADIQACLRDLPAADLFTSRMEQRGWTYDETERDYYRNDSSITIQTAQVAPQIAAAVSAWADRQTTWQAQALSCFDTTKERHSSLEGFRADFHRQAYGLRLTSDEQLEIVSVTDERFRVTLSHPTPAELNQIFLQAKQRAEEEERKAECQQVKSEIDKALNQTSGITPSEIFNQLREKGFHANGNNGRNYVTDLSTKKSYSFEELQLTYKTIGDRASENQQTAEKARETECQQVRNNFDKVLNLTSGTTLPELIQQLKEKGFGVFTKEGINYVTDLSTKKTYTFEELHLTPVELGKKMHENQQKVDELTFKRALASCSGTTLNQLVAELKQTHHYQLSQTKSEDGNSKHLVKNLTTGKTYRFDQLNISVADLQNKATRNSQKVSQSPTQPSPAELPKLSPAPSPSQGASQPAASEVKKTLPQAPKSTPQIKPRGPRH